MFDFFKDLYYEAHGVDSKAIECEKKEKKEKRNEEKIIFSSSQKVIFLFLGLLYLLLFLLNAIVFGVRGSGALVTHILLCILDIAACTCLMIRTKKTEIAALILMILFGVCLYVTSVFS